MENRNINNLTSSLHTALDTYSCQISKLKVEASYLAALILDKGAAHWALNANETKTILKRIGEIKEEQERLDSYKDSHMNNFTDATPSCNE